MADVTRTFLAVPLPDTIVSAMTRLRETLETEIPGVRWVASGQYHLTLAFLGDVRNTDLERIARATEEAGAGFEPIELRVEGLGAFPNPSRMRVLWVGMSGSGIGELMALQQALVRELGRVGYRPDDQRFTPHVTLARFQSRPGQGR